MSYVVLVLIDLALLAVGLCYYYHQIEVLKVFALSISVFFMVYSVISGLLFAFDRFSFINALIIEGIIAIIFLCWCVLNNKNDQVKLTFAGKRDLAVLVLIGIAMPFTFEKYEIYSTGRDQGLYQAEAIELFMDNYDVQHDFEEYQILSNEEDKTAYRKMVNETFLGYYPLRGQDLPTVKEDSIISDVSGMYHGVQTFPAILALWGKMFGLEKIVNVQTIFFVCSIILLYYVLESLKVRGLIKFFASLIYALSPLVLWISKTSFTEMFLTLIIVNYLLALFDEKNHWLAGLSVLAFAFVHVSYFILLPLFVFIDLFMYVTDKNKQFLSVNIISAISLAVGYTVMSIIAPQYFFGNVSRLFFGHIVTKNNFMMWIYCVSFFIILVNVFVGKYSNCLQNVFSKSRIMLLVKVVLFISLLYILWYGYKIGFKSSADMYGERAVYYTYYGKGIEAYLHLSLFTFAMATGFIVLPFVIYNMFISLEKNNLKYLVLSFLFLYMIIIQSAFIRKEVPFYYYYSRYLVLYIPIICAICAMILDWYSNRVATSIIMISICFMMPFNIVLYNSKDETFFQWEILLDLQEAIEENSAIVLGTHEIAHVIGPQLRAVTGAAIFPEFEDVNNEFFLLESKYSNVYYLNFSKPRGMDELINRVGLNRFEVVYRDRYLCSRNIDDSSIGIFPLIMEEEKRNISLYEYRTSEQF